MRREKSAALSEFRPLKRADPMSISVTAKYARLIKRLIAR
jgi:hypothetical protein